MRSHHGLLIAILSIAALSVAASACEVPVFRYALERWPTEKYILEYDTTDGLSDELKTTIEHLESSLKDSPAAANLAVRAGGATGSQATLSCPLPNGRTLKIWSGQLTTDMAGQMADSPLRREVAGRLGEGQNAVWVFLRSGHEDKDRTALKTLENNLAEFRSSMSLPEAVSMIDGEGLPELRVDFSVVEMSRDDPAEEIFREMLIASEPDLANYAGQPMAFPIFGRGRVLYALVGNGINRDNIRDACAFLIGPCACEIKDLSPGMDLLMAADWTQLAGGSWVDRVTGGPLTSLASIIGIGRQNSGYGQTSAGWISAPVVTILLAVAGILAFVVVVSFRIIRSSKKRDQ